MTAGHCVYIKGSGVPGRDGWVKKITVMPGRNGSSLPYGSVISMSFRSVVGWTTNGDQNYDYGAIIIPTELGNTTGWFGFGVWSDAELVASTGNISGYPGDKPSGSQWYHARKIVSVNSRKVFYDIDTAGGQSGAAVYRIIKGAQVRHRDPRLRRGHDKLGDEDLDAGAQQHAGVEGVTQERPPLHVEPWPT